MIAARCPRRFCALLAMHVAANTVLAAVADAEGELWAQIAMLRDRPASTQPFEASFGDAAANSQALLQQAELYLKLYPGGAHVEQVVEAELEARFQHAALTGGDLSALAAAAARYAERPPTERIGHEAAYWALIVRFWKDTQTAARPAQLDPAEPSVSWQRAAREFLIEHAASRHAPRLASTLFELAAKRADLAEQRALTSLLERAHADHATTQQLRAWLRRCEAVGQVFDCTFTLIDGAVLETRSLRGKTLLIVVWAGFDANARAQVTEIETLRRSRPDLTVVGVSVDGTRSALAAACRSLGLSWPQVYDERGWGGEFVRGWGIRSVPWVFVVDREGRLLGSAGGSAWRELLPPASN